MSIAQQGRFIVVAGVSLNVGQGIEREQRLCLWTHGNRPRKWIACRRIASRDRLILCIRQITTALGTSGHQARSGARTTMARPLIRYEEIRAVIKKRRNSYWATEGPHQRNAVVAVLWKHKSGERIGLRIEDRVFGERPKAPVVERLRRRSVLADCG